VVHSGDGDERRDLSFERGDHPIDLHTERGDGLVQEVELGQDPADDERMVAAEAALEGALELRKLGPELAPGQLGEDLGVAGAGDECVEHVATGLSQDVAGHRGELDAGVLEHLVEALGLAAALVDLGLAIAGEITKLADLFGRDERRPDQAVLDELADPFGVGHVGLSSRHVAQVPGVEDPALGGFFEHVEHRLPINARRLHPDQGDPLGDQPVAQGQQVGGHGPERHGLLLAPTSFPRGAHTGDHGVFVDVESAAAFNDDVHGVFLSGPLIRHRVDGPPGRSLVAMDSDPRARGNSSVLPRLPRPTNGRARAHHRADRRRPGDPSTVFMR
jgi:hypothetical protein